MSINPLVSSLGSHLGAIQRPATDAARARTEHTTLNEPGVARAPEPQRGGTLSGIAQPAQRTLSAAAPTGTDPELWSVLTSEERTFFAKVGSMGPLTYGRTSSNAAPSAPPSIRGGRLDIKV